MTNTPPTTQHVPLEKKYFPTVLQDYLPIKELGSEPETSTKTCAFRLGHDVDGNLVDLDEKQNKSTMDFIASIFKKKRVENYYLIYKLPMRIQLEFPAQSNLDTQEFKVKCGFEVKITKPLQAIDTTSSQQSFREVLYDSVVPIIKGHLSRFSITNLQDAQLSAEGLLRGNLFYDADEWVQIKLVELSLDYNSQEHKNKMQKQHDYEIDALGNRVNVALESEKAAGQNLVAAVSEVKIAGRDIEEKLGGLLPKPSAVEPDVMKTVVESPVDSVDESETTN